MVGGSSATYISEEGQHFVVRRIIRDEETQIGVIQDSSNSNQASTPPGNDGYIFPGVLAFFPLAVMGVIQGRDGQSEGFDAGGGTVLPRAHRDVDGLWALKAAWNIIVCLGSALAEIGPGGRIILKAMFVGSLGAPDDAGRGTRRVQASVRAMSLMSTTELAVDLGARLAGPGEYQNLA